MPDETMPDDRELLQQVIRALYRSEGNYLELRARMLDIHRVCTSVPAEGGGCGAGRHSHGDPPVCWNCVEEWPCTTARALGVD